MFALILLLSGALAYHAARAMTFSFPIAPGAAATWAMRIQLIRAIGLGFAALLMPLVIFAALRAARGALALRWVLGAATSMAFLRGAGLVDPLTRHDLAILATSALQLGVAALAILLLY